MKPMEHIKEFITEELAKRGYHAPIIKFEVERGRATHVLKITTDYFQTTPTLFKRIQISNFGGTVEVVKDRTKLWIPLHISWESFGGGSNGTSLFTVHAEYVTDNEYTKPSMKVTR